MGDTYHKEIESLKDIKDMVGLSIEALESKIRSLENQNMELKKEVRSLKTKVRNYEQPAGSQWDFVGDVRFRWFMPGEDDVCFEGLATVKINGGQDENGFDDGESEAYIHECYKHDNDAVISWLPYGRDYDKILTETLEQAAIDAYYNPPALKVVFPGE